MEPSSNQNQGNQGPQKKPNRGGRGQKKYRGNNRGGKNYYNNNPTTTIHISNNKFFTELKCTSAQNIGI